MAFYCVPCLEPRVPGYYLAKVKFQGKHDMYYWNSLIRTVIRHKWDDTWWVMPDYDIGSALERIYGNENERVSISGFHVFEHGVDTTQPNDDARFLQCAWSDYGVDGLSVCVNVHVVGQTSRRSSTTSQ